jgi:hypothetical protein
MTPNAYFAAELGKLEKAFANGIRLWPLFEAVQFCHIHNLPLPEWAALGVLNVILERHRLPGNERRAGTNPLARARRERADYRRWFVLEQLLREHELPPEPKRARGAPKKGERDLYQIVYEKAEKRLRGTPERGTITQIITSHDRVARAKAAGADAQFVVWQDE